MSSSPRHGTSTTLCDPPKKHQTLFPLVPHMNPIHETNLIVEHPSISICPGKVGLLLISDRHGNMLQSSRGRIDSSNCTSTCTCISLPHLPIIPDPPSILTLSFGHLVQTHQAFVSPTSIVLCQVPPQAIQCPPKVIQHQVYTPPPSHNPRSPLSSPRETERQGER